MKVLYVFYDGDCGLCTACRRWLSDQPQWVPLILMPYQSAEARHVCPVLDRLDPGREIVVMADSGEIYQGDSAWLMVLWATRAGRPWAARLARPALRRLAKRVVRAVSQNRLRLSRFLSLRPDRALTG